MNTGLISSNYAGFRGFGTALRRGPKADGYRQYRGNALKRGTGFRMLMRGKEHLQQSFRAIEHGKAGDVIIPFQKETKHAHMLRRHGDKQLGAVLGNGEPHGASFFLFHASRVAYASPRRKAGAPLPYTGYCLHYNDLKDTEEGAPVAIARELGYSLLLQSNPRWRMFNEDRPVGNPAQIFRSFLKNKGLRNTPQRQQIMEVFFNESGHLTTEEIYDRVRKEDPSLGQATVYRTMKLLCEAGLAREVRFGDGLARYEHAADAHHDHLICENCGRNIEVVDSQIEDLQDALARKHGFKPTFHRLYLYGICPDCQKNR